MKEIVYFKFNTATAVLFREDDECIFDFNTHKPFAFIEDNMWFSYSTHKPIAFEENGVVFDYKNKQPIFYYET